jgi:hypothetical protein
MAAVRCIASQRLGPLGAASRHDKVLNGRHAIYQTKPDGNLHCRQGHHLLVRLPPMKTKCTRWLALASAVLMLAGCGSSNQPTQPAAEPAHAAPEHTPAEEAAHNSAAEGQQKYNEAYEHQQRADQPEEEKLRRIRERVEYERGG